MKGIKLSGKELLYIAVTMGYRNFWAIRDPFIGEALPDVIAEISDLRLSLEARGLASVGFDRGFSVDQDLLTRIGICASCDRFLVIEQSVDGNELPRKVVYIKGNKAILLFADADEYLLTFVSRTELEEIFNIAISTSSFSDLYKTNVCLEHSKLLKAKETGGTTAINYLVSAGCTDFTAKAIASGLSGVGGYVSFTLTDCVSGSCIIQQLILSETGALGIDPLSNENGSLDFCWKSKEEIVSDWKCMLDRFFLET